MSVQMTIRNAICSATVCAGLAVAPADAAPRIEGAATRECRDTLGVAVTAFHSKAFRLDDAITLPRDAPVQIVSERQAGDITGGNGVDAEGAMFKALPAPRTTLPNAMNVRELYWQIKPTRGIRWVIADEPFSWRGDFYPLFAIDPVIAETAFVPLAEDKGPRAILTDAWMPPLMLRDRRSGEVWAVATAPTAWSVYTAGKDGVKQRCTVLFGPNVKTALDLLPAPIRVLAVDLDGTVGDGYEEGTLHPTDRIRRDVSLIWSDIALRPWAVTFKPYHSRRNAELGLRRWSQGAASFRALYRRIQVDYPAALDALTDFYVQRFGKTPEAARQLAQHNLDIVYRSHFVFSQSYIFPARKKP